MQFEVVFTTPTWQLSGVNTMSANLARALIGLGVKARIVITRPDWKPADPLVVPQDGFIEELPTGKHYAWPDRWKSLIRYLEARAPCIYVPNYDWNHSCIGPRLSNRVAIVGIAHSDEPVYYDLVASQGRYWNAIVAVSTAIKNNIATAHPSFAPRLSMIPYGVNLPAEWNGSRPPGKTLRIIYSGRLVTKQKRIFDLPVIMESLLGLGVPAELSIVGSGKEQTELMARCYSLIERGAVRFFGSVSNARTCELYGKHDVFLLTSDFEGMPVSMLEAMAHGCVPVVSDIASGIPEVITDGVNGYRVRVGEIETFAARLALLHQEPQRRHELAVNAYRTISEGGYRSEDMARRYLQLCCQIMDRARSGEFVRPKGRIVPPPSLRNEISWKSHVPRPMRKAYWHARQLLKKKI